MTPPPAPSRTHDVACKLMRLQSRVFWDRGDILLDAMAAYFGSRISFYFAWLRFYTGAMVYPTLMGLLLWWTEEAQEMELTCALGSDSNLEGVSTRPWWEWSSVKMITRPTAGIGNSWRSASSSLAPYFNIFLAVWSTLMMVMWKRRSSTLAFRWGVHKEDTIERAKYMARWTHKTGRNTPSACKIKSQPTYHTDHVAFSHKADKAVLRRRCAKGIFRAKAGEAAAAAIEGDTLGVERLDGLEEFRSWEPLRTGRLFVSWVLEAGMLYLAIRMMLWFAWFEKFGGGFNLQLVRIASVIIPTAFFGIHAKWAQVMTSWEGHVTDAGAENSLIVKRFTFRCVNSFSRLFYLGFWQRDLVGLQHMLVTVLITKAFIDVIQEIATPYVQLFLRKRAQSAEMRESAETVDRDVDAACRQQHQYPRLFHGRIASGQQRPEVSCRVMEMETVNPEKKQMWRVALANEKALPAYEAQGEYVDIMVQYGFVTMFAVAFPLAPLLALVRCVVELYISHRKLLLCRRPPYVDRSGIGAWYCILDAMGMASVLTNCILIGLTAESRRLHIPTPLANQFPHSKYIVMAVFVEHMILGLKAVVRMLIDDVPDGVERAMAEELLHDQDETRRKVEGALGLEEDVEATQVTIVRLQQQMTIAEDPLSHSFSPSQAPLGINDQSLHSIDSLPPSSVHMLSSERFREAAAASTRRRRQGQHPPPSSAPSQDIPPSSLSGYLQRRELLGDSAVRSVTTESTSSLKRKTRLGLRSAWRKPA